MLMPVTALDPKTALIVVDLQKGLRSLPTLDPMVEVINQSAKLAKAFRTHGLPVILVNVNGAAPGRIEQARSGGTRSADWADLVPELEQVGGDHLLTKQTWGAFTKTGLAEHLRERGVTQVVIAGVATSMGVESTARHAHELGFHVTVATDAITDIDKGAHRHSLAIFSKLGETGSTSDILSLLERSQ